MGFNFTFRHVGDRNDLVLLVDFLMKQRLGYPNYEDWVQKAEGEIEGNYKTAILAFSGGNLVGDLIYQPHKDISRIRELKNMRIHPQVKGRYFSLFMLRQAEVENREDYDSIICDLHANQRPIFNVLRLMGYSPLTTAPLYDLNVPDTIMIKCFDKASESGIKYNTEKLILSKSL